MFLVCAPLSVLKKLSWTSSGRTQRDKAREHAFVARSGSKPHRWWRPLTSDGLQVGGEHEQLDEAAAERRVVVLPDDGGDEEDFAVTGQQQGSEEKAELRGPPQRHPQEAQGSAAEGQQLCVGRRQAGVTKGKFDF